MNLPGDKRQRTQSESEVIYEHKWNLNQRSPQKERNQIRRRINTMERYLLKRKELKEINDQHQRESLRDYILDDLMNDLLRQVTQRIKKPPDIPTIHLSEEESDGDEEEEEQEDGSKDSETEKNQDHKYSTAGDTGDVSSSQCE